MADLERAAIDNINYGLMAYEYEYSPDVTTTDHPEEYDVMEQNFRFVGHKIVKVWLDDERLEMFQCDTGFVYTLAAT